MRIGCCVPTEKYELAVQVGYDYAEFPAWEIESLTQEQLDALLDKIRQLGVPSPRLNAYCRGVPAIVGDAFDEETTRAYARRLMKKAGALGVECIGIGAPPARVLPEGYDRALADKQCLQFLRITAQEAAPYGITLLLESLQSGVCNYINEMAQSLDMVKQVNMDNVKLMADLYHMETQGESWDILPQYTPWIGHMHVSTVGEGLARGLYGAGDEAACQKAFQAIARCGYDATVSIEPDASALNGPDMETALKMMRQACRQA